MDSILRHRLLYRILTGVLLTVYIAIYPAVIICDLHCEIDQRSEDGLTNNHSSMIITVLRLNMTSNQYLFKRIKIQGRNIPSAPLPSPFLTLVSLQSHPIWQVSLRQLQAPFYMGGSLYYRLFIQTSVPVPLPSLLSS